MGPMSERFEMRVDEDILAKVDKWRGDQDDVPSRAEAMRRLVELGLGEVATETVKFSDGEKILMMMLRDIYKHLKIDGDIDPDFVGEVLWGGHYWAPKWILTGLFHGHQDDPRDLHLVMEVLDMWELVEFAYENCSKKEKDRIAKEADPFGKSVKFPGFDGNNEASHLGIARFFVEKMDRWNRFEGRAFNSHHPTLEMYRRMLETFGPMRKGLGNKGLSPDQLIQILNAMKYRE